MSQKGLVVAAAAGFVAGASLSGAIAFLVTKWLSSKKETKASAYPRRKDVFRQGEGTWMIPLWNQSGIT
jgi:hypothetical protein